MADLIIRNVRTVTDPNPVDVAMTNGVIVAIGSDLTETAATEIDGEGGLVSAPFVDAHFHLDSVLTKLPNASGTLREGIDNWGAYKRDGLSVPDIVERASRYCEHAFSQGIMAIRSHVDVSDPQLRTVEGLLRVREQFDDRIDIQLVAFPQDGFYGSPDTKDRLLRALDMGVDVVGGIPHNEPTYEDGTRSIHELVAIAAERGLQVDMHCDESDDPLSRHVETLAAATIANNMQGRVAASHITASATYDRYFLSRRLIPMMQRAELRVITNPLINVHLGGHFSYPAHRAMAPIQDYRDAGLVVACAQDCNQDPWYPIGDADMFEVAKMAGHIAHLMGEEEFAVLFDLVTKEPARILGLENYGLAVGGRGDLVVFDADTPKEAMRRSAARKILVRNGSVV
ncbi:MAG: cytosine deaminase [Alkalispirochaeta sp.]